MNRSLLLLLLPLSLTAQGAHDIYVSDKVAVQRTVIAGPSSRMIAVGHPGGFNFAFDAVHCAPVYAWFGGFIDFQGETTGRGGRFCQTLGIKRPLGTDVIPLRIGTPEALPKTLRFRGYRRDSKSGNPTFLFSVNGIDGEQTLASPAPDTVVLRLNFPGGLNAPAYYLLDPELHARVELGENLRWHAAGVVAIPAGTRPADITIGLKPTGKTFTRKTPELTGAQVFQFFCNACHSTDGSRLIGPTFKGLWGRRQTVTRAGKTEHIEVADDYVLESVMKPQAAIVKGFEAVPMADFSALLTPAQISRLIEHLKTIR